MKTKILLLSLCTVLLHVISFSQTEQGRWILSGKTGLHFTHTFSEQLPRTEPIQTTSTLNQFSINPSFGYFVANNLAVQLSTTYEYKNLDDNATQNDFIVLPELVYFIPTNKPLRPFIQAGAGYSFTNTKDSGNSITKYGGFTFGGGLGVSYFVNKYFSVDLGGQYTNMNLKNKNVSTVKIKSQSVSGLVGLSIYL